MTSEMREAFERWFSYDGLSHKAIQRDASTGHYILMQTHLAWEAWQAAYATLHAEGYREGAEWQDIATAPKDGEPLDLWVVHSSFGHVRGRIERDAKWGGGTKSTGWYSWSNLGLDFEYNEEEDGSLTTSRPTHWRRIPKVGPNGEKDGARIAPLPAPQKKGGEQ